MWNEENYWTKALRKNRLARRQLLKAGAAAGLGLAGVSLIGCGQQENKPAGGTESSPSGSQTGAKKGGILNIAMNGDPPHLDPHTGTSYLSGYILQMIYSGLLKTYDYPNPDGSRQVKIILDAAESYSTPDDKTYEFKLRKGIKFHKLPPVNGREMTSEDVKYSFERIASPGTEFVRRSLFEDVERIETPDKYTVRFVLKQPSVPFLMNIANAWSLIVPKELVDADGDLKRRAIGTGFYYMEDWTRNVAIKFKRHAEYFLQDRPLMDGINYRIIPDSSTSLAAFRAGELDISGISFAEVENMKKSNPDVTIQDYPLGGRNTMGFRVDREPFKDMRVRQAFQCALDYQEFIDVHGLGQGKQDGPIQWWLKDFALPEAELPKHDVEKAKKLMAEAGYANGFKVQATVSQTLGGVSLMEVAQQQLKNAINVDIEMKVLEWGAWLNKVWGEKDFNVYTLMDWNYLEPDFWLYPYFHSKGSQNYSGWKNAQYDELIDKSRRAFKPEERQKLILDASRILQNEAPYIFLYTPVSRFAWHPYVKDFLPMASSETYYHNFQNVWLDK